MATTRSESAPPKTTAPAAGSDVGGSLIDWLQVNSRLLGIAAAVVVVAAVGYWFYLRSAQLKSLNAERALLTAQQSLGSGNAQLAQSDLQRIVTRYEGTPAGVEAALLLAQLDYDAGKYQDGINILEKAAGKATEGTLPSIYGLRGDGYAQLGKMADAAKQYVRAADAAAFDNEKAYQRSKAARSYAAAGNTEEAKKIWSALAKDPKAEAVAAEARVRLAELEAKPAGRS